MYPFPFERVSLLRKPVEHVYNTTELGFSSIFVKVKCLSVVKQVQEPNKMSTKAVNKPKATLCRKSCLATDHLAQIYKLSVTGERMCAEY